MAWTERHRNRSLVQRPIPWGNEPTPEYTPTFTLDQHIAQARAEMGEEAWAQRQAEWNAKP